MDVLTWILAIARAYSLATLSSGKNNNVAIRLDVSGLGLSAASMAWLREVPQCYVCCMPVVGEWTSFEDSGVITYYRGQLVSAERFSLHLLRPPIHHYLQNTESFFVALLDHRGTPVRVNTLYFLDTDKPTETTVAYMGPVLDGMTKVC